MVKNRNILMNIICTNLCSTRISNSLEYRAYENLFYLVLVWIDEHLWPRCSKQPCSRLANVSSIESRQAERAT